MGFLGHGRPRRKAKEQEQKQGRPQAENCMGDKGLKEELGNMALNILVEAHELDANDLAGAKVTFAYLLKIENHGLEALFKVLKNGTLYYFAAQGDTVMRVALNEGQYRLHKEKMREQWGLD